MSADKKTTVFFFGASPATRSLLPAIDMRHVSVVGIIDENATLRKTAIHGISVTGIETLAEYDYDYVFLACHNSDKIAVRLHQEYGIAHSKFVYCNFHQKIPGWPTYPSDKAQLAREIYTYLSTQRGLEKAFHWMQLAQTPYLVPLLGSDARVETAKRLSNEIVNRKVPGAVAELGVYKGEFSQIIHELFPDRPLYLFDTFEGFLENQLHFDRERFDTIGGDYTDTCVQDVLGRLGFPPNCIIKKGHFPSTACGLDETFAFVSLDADLYEPTRDGLTYFYPRLSPGGYIMVHDYGHEHYRGCGEAVREYCLGNGLGYTPIADIGLSVVIAKPL